MLLITTFVELRVVAGRSRTRAGSPQAVSRRPCCCGLEKNGMVRAWHGRGMASLNQTRPHCVNQMGKTHSKPLAAWHGRETAWARHAMCESALTVYLLIRRNTLSIFRSCTVACTPAATANPYSCRKTLVAFLFSGTPITR
jgi:hypothetical protein